MFASLRFHFIFHCFHELHIESTSISFRSTKGKGKHLLTHKGKGKVRRGKRERKMLGPDFEVRTQLGNQTALDARSHEFNKTKRFPGWTTDTPISDATNLDMCPTHAFSAVHDERFSRLLIFHNNIHVFEKHRSTEATAKSHTEVCRDNGK